jgi:hypothetical protein
MVTGLRKPKDDALTTAQFAKSLDRIDKYMVGVVLVSGLGFITLLATVSGLVIDAYRFKASYYEKVDLKVTETNQLLKTFLLESGNAKISAEILELKLKNPYLK